MPKILSRIVHFILFSSALCLFACGQKGALYLGKAGADQTDQPIFAPQNTSDIIPNYVQLQSLTVGGALAQINPTHLPSWQALLAPAESPANLIRYVVFDGDVLGQQNALTVLKGTVQNPNVPAAAKRQLTAGSYLRFRSLETGVNYLPGLLAGAQRFLDKHPTFRRADGRADFLTETEQNIDLYIAVEKR